MKVVLASHLIAYNLYTLMVAADKNQSKNVRGLQVQLPASSFESANSGATAKLGKPNSGATDVDPDLALAEGDSDNYPQSGTSNTIALLGISAIASVDNAVLYVNPLVA